MEAPEATAQVARHHAVAMSLVVAGLVLVAISVVWPRVFTSRTSWPEDKALSYQAAASRLHQLSMQAAAATVESQTRAAKEELAKAEAEYAQLRGELDSVREQPRRIARILRYTGAGLLVAGVAALLMKR